MQYSTATFFMNNKIQKEFQLYKIDMKYIRDLHNKDDKVMSVSPQINKDNRVFIGIIIVCNKQKYCIPLSSPKEKHKNMKNSLDFLKIIVDNKLIGVLNFNHMIPVEKEQLQQIDINIYKNNKPQSVYYKELCRKELQWCNEHSEIICNKANVLYEKYVSNKPFKGRNRCVNFIKLENVCKKYNKKIQVQINKNNTYKEIVKNTKNPILFGSINKTIKSKDKSKNNKTKY